MKSYPRAISCATLAGFTPFVPSAPKPASDSTALDDARAAAAALWQRMFSQCGQFRYSGRYVAEKGGRSALLSVMLFKDLEVSVELLGPGDSLDALNGVEVRAATAVKYPLVALIERSSTGGS